MDAIQKSLLEQVAELHDVPEGAYNIRANGKAAARNTTAHIDIVSKTDKDGIDIIIKPGTKNESVHIPVVLSESGLTETVYNDFFIGDDCDVTIVAGCGIHNCGVQNSEHSGIHTFHVGKRAKVRYVERHYGEGPGTGKRIMNPQTVVPCVLHGGDCGLLHLVRGHPQLSLHVQRGGGDEGVHVLHAGVQYSVHIGGPGTGQAAHCTLGSGVHQPLQGVSLNLGGSGESRLHDVNAKVVQCESDTDLVLRAECDARCLLAVPESGIEDGHFARMGQAEHSLTVVPAYLRNVSGHIVHTGSGIHAKHLEPSKPPLGSKKNKTEGSVADHFVDL